MITVIKKSDSSKEIEKKLSKVSSKKSKNIMDLFGSIKLKHDPLIYQKEARGRNHE